MKLSCKNITVDFIGLRALDNVSLSLETNEILGLIGPNGSGKTTLLNVFGGQLKPNSGLVQKDNLDLTNLSPRLKVKHGLARSFQVVRTFDTLTSFENIKAASLISEKNSSEKNNYCNEIIHYLNLDRIRDSLASALNFGDRRRLEIARAMVTNPDFLLLDEPAAGMNDQETREIAKIISEIRDELGITVLVVEHDMSLVNQVSDRVLAMANGQPLALGSPAEVQAHPDVQAAYLGTGAAA